MAVNRKLDLNSHNERRNFRKFQRGETKEQRKELADIMKAEKFAKISLDRLQQNAKNYGIDGLDFFVDRDIDLLQKYIEKYGENFMPGINTDTVKKLQEDIEERIKEKAFIEAEDSFKRVQENLKGKFSGPFEIHMDNLKGFVKHYGDGVIPGITIEKIVEIQKKMDSIEAPKMFNEAADDLKEGRRFILQDKLKHLKKIIHTYGENFVQGLTYDALHELAYESLEIFGKPQIGIVYKISPSDSTIFVSPDNGDYQFVITNSPINVNEGDKVECVINSGKNVVINRKLK